MIDEYNILRKKRRKNNGFAATALLISLGVIILLVAIFVFLLGKVDKKDDSANSGSGTTTQEVCNEKGECTTVVSCGTKESVFNENLKTIKDAAVSYFTLERMPKKKGEVKKITLSEMQKEKMVLSIIDSNNNKCSSDKSYVEVTKDTNEYVMKIYLSCSDMEDYIIIHLGCYDYCKGTVCEKQDDNGKTEFEYEYKKTTACTMSEWSKWSEWKTTKEATSNLKKEETKVETIKKTVVETADIIKGSTSISCTQYGSEYKLTSDKKYCVKYETVKETIEGTPASHTPYCEDKTYKYNVTTRLCEKEVTESGTLEKPATKNADTYDCSSYAGTSYNSKTGKCEKVDKQPVVTTTSKSCSEYGSNYKLSGDNCVASVKTPVYVEKKAVYETKTEKQSYTCWKLEGTTKTVFDCSTGSCKMVPQTSYEQVKSTCTRNITKEIITGYACPSDTTESGNSCVKYEDSVDTKPAKIIKNDSCNKYGSNYSIKNGYCVATLSYEAKKNVTTYNCDYLKAEGYSLVNIYTNKCVKSYSNTKTLTMEPKYKDEGIVCREGYTPNGNVCERNVTKETDKKDAIKTVIPDKCPDGYKQNGNVCEKKVEKEEKVTYYRYATRTCTGGYTDIKWSSSNNDKSLLDKGYKLTGNKKEVKNTFTK